MLCGACHSYPYVESVRFWCGTLLEPGRVYSHMLLLIKAYE
jgi:hypothetical protein